MHTFGNTSTSKLLSAMLIIAAAQTTAAMATRTQPTTDCLYTIPVSVNETFEGIIHGSEEILRFDLGEPGLLTVAVDASDESSVTPTIEPFGNQELGCGTSHLPANTFWLERSDDRATLALRAGGTYFFRIRDAFANPGFAGAYQLRSHFIPATVEEFWAQSRRDNVGAQDVPAIQWIHFSPSLSRLPGKDSDVHVVDPDPDGLTTSTSAVDAERRLVLSTDEFATLESITAVSIARIHFTEGDRNGDVHVVDPDPDGLLAATLPGSEVHVVDPDPDGFRSSPTLDELICTRRSNASLQCTLSPGTLSPGTLSPGTLSPSILPSGDLSAATPSATVSGHAGNMLAQPRRQ